MFRSAFSRPRDWPLVALLFAALLLAAPLWSVATPTMPDYPAHLASFWLIETKGGGAAYTIHWGFIPNLASEILVPLLARVTGLEQAARLFLTMAVCMWVLGPAAINRLLFGRWNIAPLFGAFFAYNANFSWGFFNYYFASGLGFAVFAAWIACETKSPRALAGFALAVIAVYFSHIFAAATLLLMIAGYEIAQARQTGTRLSARALKVAAVYAPAALAFLALRPSNAGDLRVLFDLADTMQDRFESLVAHNFDNPAYTLPILLLAGLGLALWRGRARLHPAMGGALAVLFAGSLLAPEWAMGGWAVHLRLPPVFAAMLFAAAEFDFAPRTARALAGVALALIAWSAFDLAAAWRPYDRQVEEFRGPPTMPCRAARGC